MNVTEFRSKIKPNIKLLIGNDQFIVKEVIKFRFDDGNFYIKCFLNDGYVFADDLSENAFLLVKEVKTTFTQPFQNQITFQSKSFDFLFTAHAIAEEIRGEEIFKKGGSERFWDYKSADNSYLSFGIIDETKERLDFHGKIIKPRNVNLEE